MANISTMSSTFFDNVTEISEIVTSTTVKAVVEVLKEPELRTFLRYILAGWGTLIVGVFGLFGNTLSGIILIKPSMRSSLNLLLFFLTIWDFLFITTTILYLSIPVTFRYLNVSRVLQEVWFPCSGPYLYAIRCTAQLGSAAFTLLVTTERYIAVCWPLQSRFLCTKRKAILSAGITTAFVILYNLPRYWDFIAVPMIQDDGNGTSRTIYKMEDAMRLNKAYNFYYLTWGAFAATSGFPFLFLVIFNYLICRAISEFNKARKVMAKNSAQSKEISLTKMFVCVITLSLLVSGLNLFLTVIDTFWKLDLSWQLWYVEKVLSTFNSSVNCVFYCAFGTRFRQEFRKMFIPRNIFCKSSNRSGLLVNPRNVGKSGGTSESDLTERYSISTNSGNPDHPGTNV